MIQQFTALMAPFFICAGKDAVMRPGDALDRWLESGIIPRRSKVKKARDIDSRAQTQALARHFSHLLSITPVKWRFTTCCAGEV